MTCRLFSLWDEVAVGLAALLTDPDLPATDILIVGDHAPPFFDRDERLQFEPDQVPRDRRGIADSIRWRMDRHGGKAVIRSEPGEGTEVELVMPR